MNIIKCDKSGPVSLIKDTSSQIIFGMLFYYFILYYILFSISTEIGGNNLPSHCSNEGRFCSPKGERAWLITYIPQQVGLCIDMFMLVSYTNHVITNISLCRCINTGPESEFIADERFCVFGCQLAVGPYGMHKTLSRSRRKLPTVLHTEYPKKYAHGFVVLCFVAVMQSFIMNSHEVFIHIHQGCFAGTGAIVRLPQCQWSKPDGYGKISKCITTTKHNKAKTVCIFLGIYCTHGTQTPTHSDDIYIYDNIHIYKPFEYHVSANLLMKINIFCLIWFNSDEMINYLQ